MSPKPETFLLVKRKFAGVLDNNCRSANLLNEQLLTGNGWVVYYGDWARASRTLIVKFSCYEVLHTE